MKYLEDSEKLLIITNSNKLINIDKYVPYYNELISNIGRITQKELLDYLETKLPIQITGVDLLKAIENGNLSIYKNRIYINNVPIEIHKSAVIDDTVTVYDILVKTKKVTTNFNHLKPFIKNLMKNPFIQDKQQLANYLANDDFEITADGYLLAYKSVNNDFTSHYDNKTKHEIGTIVEVENYDCNADNLCSEGLHFATKSYINHMYPSKSNNIVLVKINPADIIAIPKEANNTKGRCVRYEVVEIFGLDKELKETTTQKIAKETKIKSKKIKNVNINKTETRVEQTKRLMKEYNGDKKKVSEIMGITISTVKRNMRRK